MNCPVDGTALALAERNGIEIDYCPQCRGVWLDRGELDKILERADTSLGVRAGQPPQYNEGYRGGGHHGGGHDGYGKRRRGGWLGELFD
ncbi:TFIIB-type zinc ribbon-containing protein [Microbacterium lacticum]|jgi:Zn-finger nucleic acid-binding protein